MTGDRAGRLARSSRRSHSSPGREWMQDVDRPAEVQALAEPARRRRVRVNREPVRRMPLPKILGRVARRRRGGGTSGSDATVRPPEAQLAIVPRST